MAAPRRQHRPGAKAAAPAAAGWLAPRPWIGLDLAIAAACVLAFWPALWAGFSDFDDHGFVLETTFWRGLSGSNIAAIFTTMHLGHYQPLTYLSYAIEYSIAGLDPRVFHATNILLHIVTALLFARLASRLIKLGMRCDGAAATASGGEASMDRAARLGGFVAALIWAVHPLRVENVAWITERRDVLSGVFFVAAAIMYLRSAAPGQAALHNRRAYVWCVVLLLLSLLAKAWGITFVAAALLVDIFPLRRLPWQVWRWGAHREAVMAVLVQKLPFAALALGFAAIAARAQHAASDETVRTLADWGLRERVMQACYGLVFYPWKTIAPTGLSALYELPASIGPFEARFVVACVCVVLTVVGVMVLMLRRPGVGVPLGAALLAYAAIVSPVLGLLQSGIQLVADRYAYLAMMPLMVLAGAGVAMLAARREGARRPILAAAGALAAVLVTLSFAQSRLWGDTRQLWEHAIASTTPGPVMLNYHARQLEKARELPAAEAQYRASLALNPAYGDSWLGLGHVLRAQGNIDGALDAYQRATTTMLNPTNAHVALGMVRVANQRRPDLAIPHFADAARALEARGNRANTGAAYLLLAAAYGESGNDREAIIWLERARRYPDTKAQAEQYLRDLGVLR